VPRSFRDCIAGLIASAAVIGFGARDGSAQSLWIPRDRGGSVTLEALKPSLELVDQDFFSAALFLNVRAPIGGSTFLVAEVPYASFHGDFALFIGSSRVSESTAGNLYLGFEGSGSGSPLFGEFGVRLPTTEKNGYPANLLGQSADLGRLDAFFAQVISVHAAFNLRTVTQGGIANRWRLGTAFAVPTEGGGDPEIFALYAWQTAYEGRAVRVGAAASGTLFITDDTGNLGGRAETQLEFHADFGPWRVRPGVEMKLPLGAAASYVPIVLGASVSVGL